MNLALRTFFRIPIIGWLVRDAVHGAPDARYYFMANLLLAFVLLLYEFGYPFLISFALTATALALIFIVVLTAADLFEPQTKATGPVDSVARMKRRPRPPESVSRPS
jgi:hypothetical protein